MTQNRQIAVAKPTLGDEEVAAVERVIHSGWITQGPEVKAFEDEFASYVGAKYASAVSNCTTALHLALLVLDIGAGDEVITVSHSYIATVNSIAYTGATPVFVDVSKQDFNIDVSLIEAAITPKTKAILCVHQMGMPCDMKAIMEIANKHDLKVVEDAACGIGSEVTHDGVTTLIGKPQGDIVCFSFHPRKVLTTGDGGMLTTDNEAYDARLKLLRQHGMAVPDTVRHGSKEVIFETYPIIGYNYRLTDLQAAVGREQLRRLPNMLKKRREIVDKYVVGLSAINWLVLPQNHTWSKSNWQSYCVLLDEGINQKEFMQYLLDLGIATRRAVMCAHREEAYRHMDVNLPVSEYCQDHGVILPLYPEMSDGDVQYVIDSIQKFEKENMNLFNGSEKKHA